jgi:hypothetical protein
MTRIAALILIAGLTLGSSISQERALGPAVGAKAPTFTLKMLKSESTFSLASNFGKRPTVLIFGSYT